MEPVEKSMLPCMSSTWTSADTIPWVDLIFIKRSVHQTASLASLVVVTIVGSSSA